ncbi:DNA-processing protein DprA [Brevibacillus dissolubilis]|uniref:DNA-processing protein DprA n=1 Tax=Brevibacillus dissolubilis TaxID=1844116 RepID=UPI00159BE390|nr:DNA-processing protein DprA [Brevibacillus dissolubilis]
MKSAPSTSLFHQPLEERDYLYALTCIEGVGRRTIHHLYNKYGSLSSLTHLLPNEESWYETLRLPPSVRQQVLFEINPDRVTARKNARLQAGLEFICFLDEIFPSILIEIPDPPVLLFYRGDITLLQRPMLGIVGTRTPSTYGRHVCQTFAKDLSNAGFMIVSGLAQGIDAEAHRTALEQGAGTIGVLGCGIDQIYPTHNRPLYLRMAESGLILSEYHPGTKPHPGFFPERNRLISGLSLGVLIVEAAERSGSLITADCANEQGRDVFAIPGPIFAKGSTGTNNLIKQGAKLVTDSKEILEEYAHLSSLFSPLSGQKIISPDLPEEERYLLGVLTTEPLHWDEIFTRISIEYRPCLDRDLVRLETKNLIQSLPGGYYVKHRDE